MEWSDTCTGLHELARTSRSCYPSCGPSVFRSYRGGCILLLTSSLPPNIGISGAIVTYMYRIERIDIVVGKTDALPAQSAASD